MIRQATNEIRTIGRNTQGVRLIRLDEGAKISSDSKVVKEEDEKEAKKRKVLGAQGITWLSQDLFKGIYIFKKI